MLTNENLPNYRTISSYGQVEVGQSMALGQP